MVFEALMTLPKDALAVQDMSSGLPWPCQAIQTHCAYVVLAPQALPREIARHVNVVVYEDDLSYLSQSSLSLDFRLAGLIFSTCGDMN